ncbi:hypothetical protein HYW74_00795, partial [Candidatus Pacearchaeota archaeon]|nr:hypothetical protein [Candidatus Pacearchaeota archaeon]
LEHTNEISAKNLGEMGSKNNYKLGVNVFEFDKVENPLLRVVSLYSDRLFDGYRLVVNGSNSFGLRGGVAFGVLDNDTVGVAPKK